MNAFFLMKNHLAPPRLIFFFLIMECFGSFMSSVTITVIGFCFQLWKNSSIQYLKIQKLWYLWQQVSQITWEHFNINCHHSQAVKFNMFYSFAWFLWLTIVSLVCCSAIFSYVLVISSDDVIVTGVLSAKWSPDIKDVRSNLDPMLIANYVR